MVRSMPRHALVVAVVGLGAAASPTRPAVVALVGLRAAARRDGPTDRSLPVGRWTAAPTRTPDGMAVDGPVLGNGDLGVGVAAGGGGAMNLFFSKLDFWTDQVHDMALCAECYMAPHHVSPGRAALRFAALGGGHAAAGEFAALGGGHGAADDGDGKAGGAAVAFAATQETALARVNATLEREGARVTTSTIVDPTRSVSVTTFTTSVDTDFVVELTQAALPGARAANALGLPMRAQVSEHVAALSMLNNKWVHEDAVLSSCDPDAVNWRAARFFRVDGDGTLLPLPASRATAAASTPDRERCVAIAPEEGRSSQPRASSLSAQPRPGRVVGVGPCDAAATFRLVDGRLRYAHRGDSDDGKCVAYAARAGIVSAPDRGPVDAVSRARPDVVCCFAGTRQSP